MFWPESESIDSAGDFPSHQLDSTSSIPTFAPPVTLKHRRPHRGGQDLRAVTTATHQALGSQTGDPQMSTRQNKKHRKQRGRDRDRTFTTLTGEPETSVYGHTTIEDSAAMLQAYGGNVGGVVGGGISMGPPGAYQMQNNSYGYPFPPTFSPIQSMHPQPQQQFFPGKAQGQQQQQAVVPDVQPKIPLPPGKNDLEILKNLKKLILDNQHPFYKAIPSPEALARYYKGPLPEQSQTTSNQTSDIQPSSNSAPTEALEKQQRPQEDDKRPGQMSSNNSAAQDKQFNNAAGPPSVSALDIENLAISKGTSGSSLVSESRSNLQPPGVSRQDISRFHDQDKYRAHAPGPGSFSRPGNADYDSEVSLNGRNWVPRDAEGSDRYVAAPAPPHAGIYDRERPRRDDYDRGSGYDKRTIDSRRPPEADFAAQSSASARGPPTGALISPNDASRTSVDIPRHADDKRPVPANTVSRPPPSDVPMRTDTRASRASSAFPPDRSAPPPSVVSVKIEPASESSVSDSSLQDPTTQELHHPSDVSHTSTPGREPQPPHRPQSDHNAKNGDTNPQNGPETLHTGHPSSNVPPAPAQAGERGYERPSLPNDGPPSGYRGTPPRPVSPYAPATGGPPPTSSYGPGLPPSSSSASVHRGYDPRSPSLETRPKGSHPPPSHTAGAVRGGPPHVQRDYRGPPSSSSGRDRDNFVSLRNRPVSYRPDWSDYPVEPDPRYDDNRHFREYSPGRGPPLPPSSVRFPPPDAPPYVRDYHTYPSSGRPDWEDDYYKYGPPPRGDTYERDYPPPPPRYGRGDREFIGRDGYPPAPSLDDRYPPGPDRGGRPPPPPPSGYSAGPYSRDRIRPRSASPRRGVPGLPPDDPRPPLKKSRAEEGYYPPPPGSRRPPPGDYPPLRSGSPGPPPPSSGSSWGGPLPPSSASSNGPPGGRPPGDRDYPIRDSYPPPPTGAYDRPRSPGHHPTGGRGGYRGSYGGRGGYISRP